MSFRLPFSRWRECTVHTSTPSLSTHLQRSVTNSLFYQDCFIATTSRTRQSNGEAIDPDPVIKAETQEAPKKLGTIHYPKPDMRTVYESSRCIPYDIGKIAWLLPEEAQKSLINHGELTELIEVILDYGRVPMARFPSGDIELSSSTITFEDLREAEHKVGRFNMHNRAGILGTLHRISCVKNTTGKIIGLTCRVGREIKNYADHVKDILEAGKSILILGPPGVGKTTAIRCFSKHLADVMHKRVIIVDTSCEIAGDGDVPHQSVGSSRRLYVSNADNQHHVMVEAVQNHTPDVLVIDEIGHRRTSICQMDHRLDIGTYYECEAARSVSKRGVQLIASAHGRSLADLLHDPATRNLIGGVETVTHGDMASTMMGLPKLRLERKWRPSFDVIFIMESRRRWIVIEPLQEAVDATLKNKSFQSQMRLAPESDAAAIQSVFEMVIPSPTSSDQQSGEQKSNERPGGQPRSEDKAKTAKSSHLDTIISRWLDQPEATETANKTRQEAADKEAASSPFRNLIFRWPGSSRSSKSNEASGEKAAQVPSKPDPVSAKEFLSSIFIPSDQKTKNEKKEEAAPSSAPNATSSQKIATSTSTTKSFKQNKTAAGKATTESSKKPSVDHQQDKKLDNSTKHPTNEKIASKKEKSSNPDTAASQTPASETKGENCDSKETSSLPTRHPILFTTLAVHCLKAEEERKQQRKRLTDLASVTRILNALTEMETLQVNAKMSLEKIQAQYSKIIATLKGCDSVKAEEARKKALKALQYLKLNHLSEREAVIKRVVDSRSHYDCLQVPKNVTKSELEKAYAAWNAVFLAWQGAPFSNKAKKRLKEAYDKIGSAFK